MANSAEALKIEDVTVGSGDTATSGSNVTVHYTGWLFQGGQKGAKFDSSKDRGDPFASRGLRRTVSSTPLSRAERRSRVPGHGRGRRCRNPAPRPCPRRAFAAARSPAAPRTPRTRWSRG